MRTLYFHFEVPPELRRRPRQHTHYLLRYQLYHSSTHYHPAARRDEHARKPKRRT